MSNECQPMKQPIRRLEIPINKFNDVAIPHHLDLLRRHKENIRKFQKLKDWDKVQREQINSSRVVKQLEQLLYEMDTLRSQVNNNDIEKFDKLTVKSRDSTINAIQEYLGIQFELPPSPIAFDDTINASTNHAQNEKFIQLEENKDEVERQIACLHAWNGLQNDLHQLHQLFIDFNKLIHDQKEQVDIIENDVITSETNIGAGTKYLEKASKLKIAAYPLAGALIGTCVGGPVGLIAGLKLGGLTALGCGVLGFTGATILKKKQLENLKHSEEQQIRTDEAISLRSVGCNENLALKKLSEKQT